MMRYGITTQDRTLGVPMGAMQALAKQVGKNHGLARALWRTKVYEGRMMAALLGEPKRVTASEMEAWAATVDNWAVCDTLCFKLWDQTPLAWEKARAWARSPREFVKRSSFALMASLALHDKGADDGRFLPFLSLIESGAEDDRNFVKKGVSWALRSIGRRSQSLRKAAGTLAARLGKAKNPSSRWVGKDAARDLRRPNGRG